MCRLAVFFTEVDEEGRVVRDLADVTLGSLTPAKGEALYASVRSRKTQPGGMLSVDSHRTMREPRGSRSRRWRGVALDTGLENVGWTAKAAGTGVSAAVSRRARAGRDPQAALFGEHWRDWPRKWVQRICKAAGVRNVTAHGMRGLHGTLAVDSGITSHAVASALGHESFKTTAES
jgi:integrase